MKHFFVLARGKEEVPFAEAECILGVVSLCVSCPEPQTVAHLVAFRGMFALTKPRPSPPEFVPSPGFPAKS